ncbi:hypothetical protein [Staphylococcus capitis]|uniref:Uncharacterized protein n=1 Tax=Staphylococcus capitis TaxID=29388 RepID=A0ABX1SNW2_STACP|nr:hypothetical protein [Staphylococcus capitis]NMK53991.1 hypothetical protein [Staphylococcus capitis]NMK69316.1 hypothetical protein [Staphylococcus capitis]
MLENDLKELEDYIIFLINQSKKHTPTEMILGNIPHSTVINFNYSLYKKPLSINSTTLRKIVRRIDELEKTSTYYDELCKRVKNFIEKNIMIGSISYLTKELGLNYTTLHKIKDYQLTTPYRLITLENYAKQIRHKLERLDGNENYK